MSRYALTGGRLVTPQGVVAGRALVVDGGTVDAVVDEAELPAGLRRIDVEGRTVAPGLVDIHTHGALGHTFNDGDPAGVATILREQARHGVTTVLATLFSAPVEAMAAALGVLAAQPDDPSAARLLGVHLEGPFLSPAQRGAHAAEHLRDPDPVTLAALLDPPGLVRLVCLAPERPGALDAARAARRRGVVVAAGHSDAHGAEVEAGWAAGITHAVHLWSSQSTVVRDGPWRVPGLLEHCFAHDDLTAEVIADGKHLPAALLRMAMAAFGPRLCAVSDSSRAAGLAEGTRFDLAGSACVVADGVAMVEDRTCFAGSTTFLDEALATLLAAGADVATAVRMASTAPAAVVGADVAVGLVAGAPADVAVLDLPPGGSAPSSAWMTIRRGRVVHGP